MKNVKINLDRPPVDSKSIQARKDFDGLMKNHTIMSKPFYKSTWFIGTSGLASIGIVVGGIVALNSNDAQDEQQLITNSEAPPEMTVPDNSIISLNADIQPKTSTEELVKATLAYSDYINNQNQIDDNTSTLENSELDNPSEEIDQVSQVELADTEIAHNDAHETTEFTSMLPRIGGKFNGAISKEELFDNKGITTESDVNVIHFELHLIDGLGGKVFEEESNQLNEEMKQALKKINSGETIYFENIKGQTEKGDIVRLNPLRYVLMN